MYNSAKLSDLLRCNLTAKMLRLFVFEFLMMDKPRETKRNM